MVKGIFTKFENGRPIDITELIFGESEEDVVTKCHGTGIVTILGEHHEWQVEGTLGEGSEEGRKGSGTERGHEEGDREGHPGLV